MNLRLALEYVQPGGEDLALLERLGQEGLLVDDRAARVPARHRVAGVPRLAAVRRRWDR